MVMPEGGRGCRKVDEARKVLILTRFARRWTDRNYVTIQTLPRLGSRVRIPSSAPFFILPYFPLSPGKSSHRRGHNSIFRAISSSICQCAKCGHSRPNAARASGHIVVMRFVLSVPARLRNTVFLLRFVLFMELSRNVVIRVVMQVVMPTPGFLRSHVSGIVISHRDARRLLRLIP